MKKRLESNRKRFSLKKRYFIGLTGIGLTGFLLVVCTLLSQPRWLFALATNLFPGALYAVDLSDGLFEGDAEIKKIALTIDDGPSPVTAEILAVLAQHNVKATFFNISGNLDGHEAVV